jgi:hypothetical protein
VTSELWIPRCRGSPELARRSTARGGHDLGSICRPSCTSTASAGVARSSRGPAPAFETPALVENLLRPARATRRHRGIAYEPSPARAGLRVRSTCCSSRARQISILQSSVSTAPVLSRAFRRSQAPRDRLFRSALGPHSSRATRHMRSRSDHEWEKHLAAERDTATVKRVHCPCAPPRTHTPRLRSPRSPRFPGATVRRSA